MKKLLFIASVLLVAGIGAYAQDDDMYFTPSKTSKTNAATSLKIQNGSYGDEDCVDYNGQDYSDTEVDAYNRRNSSVSGDTLYLGDGDKDAMEYFDDYSSGDYYYSSRLARFNEPVVNIYYGYGVPFRSFYGWYDSWYDPWYYSWYDPWWSYNSWWNYSFWGWNWYPRHYSWHYGWGWVNPHPHYAWHDFRHGAGRGWNRNPAMGGRVLSGQTHYAKRGSAGGGMIWGGGRNYRDAGNRTGSNSTYSASSRSNGNNRIIYNGQQRARINSQRSYNSSNNSTSTRSYSNSSSSSSPSMGTRSFGGGRSGGSGSSMGSRSFGGGGGGSSMGTRSFGGGGGGRR